MDLPLKSYLWVCPTPTRLLSVREGYRNDGEGRYLRLRTFCFHVVSVGTDPVEWFRYICVLKCKSFSVLRVYVRILGPSVCLFTPNRPDPNNCRTRSEKGRSVFRICRSHWGTIRRRRASVPGYVWSRSWVKTVVLLGVQWYLRL